MSVTLQRCRTVWGRTEHRDALPSLRVVTDAVYQPVTADGRWGLLDATGNTIEASGEPVVSEVTDCAEDRPTLYVGPLITHYGHFLFGTFARLWPLLTWDGPKPRLLCHPLGPPEIRRETWAALPFLIEILSRFDMTLDDLATFERPTRIPRLMVPQPSLREQDFVHDVHGTLARFVGQPFWDPALVDTEPRPVYLSKTRLGTGISRLRNEQVLCEALERGGVDIVYPESLRLSQLVRLLSERRIVLGTAGSAFHAAVFAAPGRRILGLNWAAHINANFLLLDALNGTQAHYYSAIGAETGEEAGFHFGWSLPDPTAVAVEMLARARSFDTLDTRDAEEDAVRRHAGRVSPLQRVGRWLLRQI